MLEGGGKTPILSPLELAEIGYKVVVYPLSLMGVSMRAMQVACLSALINKRIDHYEVIQVEYSWKFDYLNSFVQ